ncbi:hypothetical protein [Kibdelosporangium philippinense]|uniref:hypothetical protein n=1 Tax=Kibdelosporangium philippinense TaxID=211113 RepID=UPI00361E0C33
MTVPQLLGEALLSTPDMTASLDPYPLTGQARAKSPGPRGYLPPAPVRGSTAGQYLWRAMGNPKVAPEPSQHRSRSRQAVCTRFSVTT